ncbi:DUF4912 domain-containing protein [Heliobacterium gestii]|uniref:DUF4912 domain-containing protein n=1 Tax=Heliomicrobium gestii TaxID=2699 RepID=A0A845LM41_HELGE|nr:DUF4912 domain-containing protein [Heliomicrobium gestii]MBM7867506.1 hypothetical protein [Heliomicrobium gestii]MZP43946.1 DUF4912 domain-containing protein [Heliomicrobium gestii]
MATSLPERYDEDYIGVLVRDPYHIFIYWELTEAMRIRVLHNWGLGPDTPCRLRLEREEGNRWVTEYLAELPPGTENWYINGMASGECYRAQIGVLTPAGQFIVILASTTIHVPPSGQAKGRPGRAMAISGGIRPVALEDLADRLNIEAGEATVSSFSLYQGESERGPSHDR